MLREGVSDIHIELFEQISVVRFRIDGSLRDVVRRKKRVHASRISCTKIMAQLDIAEKRLPQDGPITLRIGGKSVDVRILSLADRPWRTRRTVFARQGSRPPRSATSWYEPSGVALVRSSDNPAAWDRTDHRADRFRQNHHAVCGAVAPEHQQHQYSDGGRSASNASWPRLAKHRSMLVST